MVIALRTLGGSVGYSIYYNIYNNYTIKHIPDLVAQYAIDAGLSKDKAKSLAHAFITAQNPVSATLGSDITKDPAILKAAHRGFQVGAAKAAQLVYYGSIPVGVLVLALTICLPDLKKYLSDNVLSEQVKDSKTAENDSA